MVFSGIPFVFLFLPVFLILYYVSPKTVRNYILLVFSLLFYAWGEPVYILLMVFSSVVDYLNGLFIKKFPHRRRIFLVNSIVINLSLLGFFKYAPLVVKSLNGLFGLSLAVPSLALPIGISFYTFQTMSYSIDVYRGDVEPETNFFTFMTYVSMFPQLIAGPIVRYETVHAELKERRITFTDFSEGFLRFLQGLFKKVLLANTMGNLFDTVTASPPDSHSAVLLWFGILAFYAQIYFDFSGYSDMAIGMGRMLGFTFLENFRYPAVSLSVSDFWRRWHISLTTWFRDYVYIPLGGSRCSKAAHIRNLLIVWGLTGLWHGATSWNFLLWGLYFGVILILEKYIYGKALEKTPRIIQHLYTTVLVTLGWAIFSLEDFSYLLRYVGKMFFNPVFINAECAYYALPYLPVFLLCVLFACPVYPWLKGKIDRITSRPLMTLINILSVIVYAALFVLTLSLLVGEAYNPFLYFRF